MNMIKNVFALNEIQILKSLGKNEEELVIPVLADHLGYDELSVIDGKDCQRSVEDKLIRAGWRR